MLTPLFGETYRKAQSSNTKEEFIKSKEAASAAALYGSTLLGSGVQTYAVAAVLNHCGVLSYKGAAYVGALIFAATSAPLVSFPRESREGPVLTGSVVGRTDVPGEKAGRDCSCEGCGRDGGYGWVGAVLDLVGNQSGAGSVEISRGGSINCLWV